MIAPKEDERVRILRDWRDIQWKEGRSMEGEVIDVCSRMLTYAHVCSRMLTDAHGCSRMLTDAHVC
jgi:hypothetical protein